MTTAAPQQHHTTAHTSNTLELLAPAGSPAAFYAALYSGADAIYCALGCDFNARRGADNFSDEEFQQACKDAHLLGVHVYVPVNIEVRTSEIEPLCALVQRAWLLGADAFIVQDWGVMYELSRRFPFIELHVSTQSNIHDPRGIMWCKHHGATRVTLSRELSLPELKELSKTQVDLECFGHGAICFCYSGICMLSSLNGQRSANRGLCAQPCRLHYELIDEDNHVYNTKAADHLLCPKDYNTQQNLEDMAAAGVHSLKIEGRMKSAAYVYAVVKAYRMRLDAIYAGRTLSAAEEEEIHNLLYRSFNRGFTTAYLKGTSGNEMMSYERSNNRGELIGQVCAAENLGVYKRPRPDKPGRFRYKPTAKLQVKLTRAVQKDDLLELRLDGHSDFLTSKVTSDAKAGDIIECQTARCVPVGCPVRLIRSQAYMDIAQACSNHTLARKRPIAVCVYAHVGAPISIRMWPIDDSRCSVEVTGDVLEAARTKALSAFDIEEHVGRIGTTAFEIAHWDISVGEGVGLGFSTLHKLRSQATDALEARILEPWEYHARKRLLDEAKETHPVPSMSAGAGAGAGHAGAGITNISAASAAARRQNKDALPVEVCALVTTPDMAIRALEAGATRLYATTDALIAAAHAGQTWPSYTTYNVHTHAYERLSSPISILDEVCRMRDYPRCDSFVTTRATCAVGNISELALCKQRGAYPEIRSCIPILNSSAIASMAQEGARSIWFSNELSLDELCNLSSTRADIAFGTLVLGRPRSMTTEHCVLQAAHMCIHNCLRCTLRKKTMYLKSERGDVHRVTVDLEGRSRIYAGHVFDATPEIPQLLSSGMSRFLVDCTLLHNADVTAYIQRVCRALDAAKRHAAPLSRMHGAYSGRLFDPIG